MDEQGAQNVVGGAEKAFGFAVLGRCIWAGESEDGTVAREVVAEEFVTIVTLTHLIERLYCM